MNGREFIDCAIRLSQSPHKAELRSSISRAYYGAFHAVRDLFEECGIRFSTSTTEAHTKMPHCMENTNVSDFQTAGRVLQTLRDNRNYADYSMNELSCEDPSEVILYVQAAQYVVQTIDRAMENPTTHENTRRILKACAKGLGLRVV